MIQKKIPGRWNYHARGKPSFELMMQKKLPGRWNGHARGTQSFDLMTPKKVRGRWIGHARGKQALPDLVRLIANMILFNLPAGLGAF